MDMCKVKLNHSSYSVCSELKKTRCQNIEDWLCSKFGYPNSNDLSSCSLAMNMIIWDRRIHTHTHIYIYIAIEFNLWKFNIAFEHTPFVVDLPIQNGDFL